ncbi:mll1902 [Mesorhizobium japonicum MAFF 303099]|uniref:Mll1902 protein n=2 Tax=Mesorhizobium japonicum TaxID=2066070 RepID=Q98JK5_RHILO|nr:mll1902 [Mesorhizobium japonicum MAFF 303099]
MVNRWLLSTGAAGGGRSCRTFPHICAQRRASGHRCSTGRAWVAKPHAAQETFLSRDMTVAIEMGHTTAGAPANLDLEELLATRLLVQGNSGSGKSHLLRRLLEQSAPWVQQTIVDPEGDFVSLGERYGHLVIDAEEHTERGLQAAGERARIHRVSTVLNLEGLDAENQMRRAAAFLGGLFEVARDHWYPMLVVVDEAQLFAPAVAGEVSDEARKLSLGAMTNLMCRGRKRGLAGIIATQRLAKLAKNVAAEASNFLMGRTFLDIDMARAADLLGMERRQAEAFRDLERGQFMALGPALSRRPLGLRIGPTDTSPRNGTPRLMAMPEAALEDARAIILAAPPPETVRTPRRVASPDLLDQLMAAKSAALEIRPEPAEPQISAEDLAERRERVDRVLRAILAQPDAGFRVIGVLYQEFVVRCRIEGLASVVPDLAEFRRMLTRARAGLGSETTQDDAWRDVSVRASLLPDDMQGVFMMIARAAKEGWPCPSDAAIARAYGSHSLRRARRLLTYIEEQGLIVCQLDGTGKRTVTLVELAWATAPGDPNAEEAQQGSLAF